MSQDRADGHPDTGPPQFGAGDLVGLGSVLVGCVVVGLLLGMWADSIWDSAPVGLLVGLGLGIVAGVVGSCVRVAPYFRR